MTILQRATNVDNGFPRRFDHLMNCCLQKWRISIPQLNGGSPIFNTHVKRGEHGQHLSKPFKVGLPRFLGPADGPRECSMLEVFRKQEFDPAEVKRAIGIDPPLDSLQLGGVGIDGGHGR